MNSKPECIIDFESDIFVVYLACALLGNHTTIAMSQQEIREPWCQLDSRVLFKSQE